MTALQEILEMLNEKTGWGRVELRARIMDVIAKHIDFDDEGELVSVIRASGEDEEQE